MAAEQPGSGHQRQQPEGQNGNNKNNSKSFGKKCSRAVKKQRAKLYIVRRCIAILLCWHDKS